MPLDVHNMSERLGDLSYSHTAYIHVHTIHTTLSLDTHPSLMSVVVPELEHGAHGDEGVDGAEERDEEEAVADEARHPVAVRTQDRVDRGLRGEEKRGRGGEGRVRRGRGTSSLRDER